MVSQVISATVIGIESYKILVEVDFVQSIPSVVIVGLPDTAVSEAKERVRSAIKNSNLSFPNQKVVINLAPADIRKEGTNYDLPIAVGILARDGIIDDNLLHDTAFLGELSLDGSLRPVNGILPIVSGLKELNIKQVVVPKENAKEAALVPGIKVLCAENLNDVVCHFGVSKENQKDLEICEIDIEDYLNDYTTTNFEYDFKDIKGQLKAKKALEIAMGNQFRAGFRVGIRIIAIERINLSVAPTPLVILVHFIRSYIKEAPDAGICPYAFKNIYRSHYINLICAYRISVAFANDRLRSHMDYYLGLHLLKEAAQMLKISHIPNLRTN